VTLLYQADKNMVVFNNPYDQALTVGLSPLNSRLRRLGARYVLAMHGAQKELDSARLIPLYVSSDASFTIYEIPASDE
jgi:hypothetical protein